MADKDEKKKKTPNASEVESKVKKGSTKSNPKKKPKEEKLSNVAEKKSSKAGPKDKTEQKKAKKPKAADSKKTVSKEKVAKAKEEMPKETGKEVKKKEYIPRLYTKYKEEIIPQMRKQFNYTNVFEIPRLTKITLNIGMGAALQNNKLLESAVEELSVISGQKPIITKAKRSISNFKLREGNPIGCKVTLRRARMYEFLERYISIAVPRIRDFRGLLLKSFDGFGNYSVGVKEQIIFPEIDYDKVESIHGMDITIVTTAKKDEEAIELLKLFGFPFVESSEIAEIA